MIFQYRLTRKMCSITALSALVLGVGGCATVGPPVPDTGSAGQTIPRYVQNLPKSKTGNMEQYTVFGKRYRTLDSAANFNERGVASWYGKKFHGRKTSSGELYDMYAMTAAHKHLPLPTYVRVTNLENNKSVIVLVNDRGPFVGDRIIDLSFAAAMEIEMAERGTAQVHVQALSTHYMDGEIPPQNANIAQADVPEPPQESAAPAVIEPQVAAVPIQDQIKVEATPHLAVEDVLTADTLAVADQLDEPVGAPAAAMPVEGNVDAAAVNIDSTEDGFVELSSLDSVPVVDEPAEVQNLASDSSPRVIKATDGQGSNAFIQLGAFSEQNNAQKMVDRVGIQVGLPAFVERDVDGSLFRVKMGPFKEGQLLDETLAQLESVGIESYTLLATKH